MEEKEQKDCSERCADGNGVRDELWEGIDSLLLVLKLRGPQDEECDSRS